MADNFEVGIPAEAVRATDTKDGDRIGLTIAFPSVLDPGSIIRMGITGVYDAQRGTIRVDIPDEFEGDPSLFIEMVRRAFHGVRR